MAVGSGEPVSPWGAWSPRLSWAAAGGQVPVYLRPVAEPGNHVPMCSPSSLCCMGGSAGSHKSASRPCRPVPSVPRALPAPGFQRLQIDAIPGVHLRAGRPGAGRGRALAWSLSGSSPAPAASVSAGSPSAERRRRGRCSWGGVACATLGASQVPRAAPPTAFCCCPRTGAAFPAFETRHVCSPTPPSPTCFNVKAVSRCSSRAARF